MKKLMLVNGGNAMSKMKYIRFEDSGIVIFQEFIEHLTMASKFKSDKVISAGFVSFDGMNIMKCYGESLSLGVKAHELDTEKVNKIFSWQLRVTYYTCLCEVYANSS